MVKTQFNDTEEFFRSCRMLARCFPYAIHYKIIDSKAIVFLIAGVTQISFVKFLKKRISALLRFTAFSLIYVL
ncbi:hypothetical protein B0F88_104189 [Methylobacter tundripaludum]|uniref:Uncharacterized protein n=1 Tax=Methylobacter tundripaludum TaxID=173365 RepID=A0A2S6H4I5_9GAMM|nr:hypothetical protein B0F88_104189 [Methylobacter tundripaludum]